MRHLDLEEAQIGPCYYFGCHIEKGHYLWNEQEQHIWDSRLPTDFPIRYETLDTGLLPPRLPEDEGKASLIHIGCTSTWTILTFWDRSLDTRPGCNSSFVIPGHFDFEEAKQIAQKKFPWIWRRFKFEVTQR